MAVPHAGSGPALKPHGEFWVECLRTWHENLGSAIEGRSAWDIEFQCDIPCWSV